jgi:hypothetical protein
MKILDTIWFTEMGEYQPIGIVIIETEVGEKKAYIGKGLGMKSKEDTKFIAERGAKLPVEILKRIIKLLGA